MFCLEFYDPKPNTNAIFTSTFLHVFDQISKSHCRHLSFVGSRKPHLNRSSQFFKRISVVTPLPMAHKNIQTHVYRIYKIRYPIQVVGWNRYSKSTLFLSMVLKDYLCLGPFRGARLHVRSLWETLACVNNRPLSWLIATNYLNYLCYDLFYDKGWFPWFIYCYQINSIWTEGPSGLDLTLSVNFYDWVPR